MTDIPELGLPQVRIAHPEHVTEVIQNIIKDGCDKLQVTADFDFTLTKFKANGTRCAGTHNVLEEGHVLPEFYKEEARALRDHYFPIETNPNLTIEEKIPIMVEWWTKAHDLFAKCDMKKDDVRVMVENSTAKLRDGCTWFFDQLHANEIPLLIFSAGIGDVIIEVIKHQATLHDNMKIVSNYLEYDAQGNMTGFQDDLIHVFNKNEGAIHDSDYFQNVEHRNNVILMGDSLGDLHMADGAIGVKNKLTIGFLNVKVEESLELYMKKYDIVIIEDETWNVANAILRKVLQNRTRESQ
ncbi:7-methylguanosine phosphate-specific 5'-nucleotidase A-like isoform X2 [Ostrea edulis]|uniref:7-methylguanosine phosphate-specific 5'-nucleotidase A-like isoform X2 n=1 Tax=Ostrea edulis TaxID=37623 RepID=UPI0024AF0484|nr:7-methylguanosine phosphate-specific 5'-nucleotidase A-like isoform X2 [Ostrea edulis]